MAQESVVTLETFLTMHIAERVDMNHQGYGGYHNQHHHTDRIQQYTEVEMQIAEGQPREVVRNNRLIDAVDAISTEVLECRHIRQDRNESERTGTDKSGYLMLHLHASQSENEERQQRQKHDKYRVTIHNFTFLLFYLFTFDYRFIF